MDHAGDVLSIGDGSGQTILKTMSDPNVGLLSNEHRFLNTGIFCIIVSITLIILPIFYCFYVLVLTVFMIWFMFSMVKCLLYCFCCCCCIRDADRNNQDLISHEEVAEQNIQI